jgi:hypothetical protein
MFFQIIYNYVQYIRYVQEWRCDVQVKLSSVSPSNLDASLAYLDLNNAV